MSSTMRMETQKMSASRRWLMQGALNMEDPGSKAEAGSEGAAAFPGCPDPAVHWHVPGAAWLPTHPAPQRTHEMWGSRDTHTLHLPVATPHPAVVTVLSLAPGTPHRETPACG